ncbi:MAG: hypothetical protein KGJ23_07700 [Euryarchaeota archaeon]|nr:hypothetical protein [Euryarchaeota archaeon]MDE1836483.1 hypothetical protein [Euryarchaeota archaeon]MDE1880252.1 hypothetical protein [Euryarchaeota archaeon]MDE2044689.1 hypothetical protein [Thermoplasmata archaeon]
MMADVKETTTTTTEEGAQATPGTTTTPTPGLMREVSIPGQDKGEAVGLVTGLQGKTETIGRVYWVSIGDMAVPVEKLKELWTAAGLPEELCPGARSPVDAFRMAVDLTGKESPFNTLVIRPAAMMVGKQAKPWARTLAWGTEKNHAFPVIGRVEFRLANAVQSADVTGTMDLQNTDDEAKKMLSSFLVRARQLFERFSSHATDDDVRRSVTTYLRTSGKRFDMRPNGALYFSPEAAVPCLDRVAKLLGLLSPYCSEHSVGSELAGMPVQQDSRDLVIKQFERIVGGKVAETIGKAQELLGEKDRKIRPSEFQGFIDELQELASLKGEYENVLSFKVATGAAAWDLLSQVVAELSKHVEE